MLFTSNVNAFLFYTCSMVILPYVMDFGVKSCFDAEAL